MGIFKVFVLLTLPLFVSALALDELYQFEAVLKPVKSGFERLLQIYNSTNATTLPEILNREAAVVEYLSSMPNNLKPDFPLPEGFTKYDEGAQNQLRRIYYDRKLDLSHKWVKISKVIKEANVVETIKFRVDATFAGLGGLYSRSQLARVLTPAELAATDILQSNASLNAMDREYAVGSVLSRAYGSAGAELRTRWPTFASANGLPSEVTAALNGFFFGKSLILFERAYKAVVEPYLPGGSMVRRWERECPCPEYALRRIKTEELQRKTEEENGNEADVNAATGAAATSSTNASTTQATYMAVIPAYGLDPSTTHRRHDVRPLPISHNPQGVLQENGGTNAEEIKFRVNATLTGLVGVYHRSRFGTSLLPSELAAIDALQKNASLSEVAREYATGDILRRAYISLSADRRTHWPYFAKTYDLPRVITDALTVLHFQPNEKESLALYVRAYKEEVEPYLPGGSLMSHWQRECPCQPDFWTRVNMGPSQTEDRVGTAIPTQSPGTNPTQQATEYTAVIPALGLYQHIVPARPDLEIRS